MLMKYNPPMILKNNLQSYPGGALARTLNGRPEDPEVRLTT